MALAALGGRIGIQAALVTSQVRLENPTSSGNIHADKDVLFQRIRINIRSSPTRDGQASTLLQRRSVNTFKVWQISMAYVVSSN